MSARATAVLMLLLVAGGEAQKAADDVKAHDRTVSGEEPAVTVGAVGVVGVDVAVAEAVVPVAVASATVSRLEKNEKKAAAATNSPTPSPTPYPTPYPMSTPSPTPYPTPMPATRDQLANLANLTKGGLAKAGLARAGDQLANLTKAGLANQTNWPTWPTWPTGRPDRESASVANLTEAGPDEDPGNSTSLIEDTDEVMGHSTTWWLWGGVLGMEIVMGFFWFLGNIEGKCEDCGGALTSTGAMLVLSLYQWAPLWAIHAGWARCSTGLPWAMHIVYAGLLALASTVCVGDLPLVARAPMPVLGLEGTVLAKAYWYGSTLLNSYDTYGDAVNVAMAYSCGWPHAWLSLTVLVSGAVLQFAAACMMVGVVGAGFALVGFNPESSGLTDSNGVKFMVSMGICRMLTENIPQGALAIWLANDLEDASPLLYINVAVSMALAAKSFANSMQRWATGNYTPLLPK